MTEYPLVVGEYATLTHAMCGVSVARYGDGELNLCVGGHAKLQTFSPTLSARLRGILFESGKCLVGLPNIHSSTPKAEFWKKYLGFSDLFDPSRAYVSAFVTRPDSAPWIDTPSYWDAVESLWRGRDVTLVRGTEKSLVAADLTGAKSVTEVIAPARDAWANYDALLEQVGTPPRAILCLGPTATVMAVDLCAKGVHALDLGHVGLFLRKHRRGEPMVVTDADKVPA